MCEGSCCKSGPIQEARELDMDKRRGVTMLQYAGGCGVHALAADQLYVK